MNFNIKSNILFEDNSIIVCKKPAGVSSQTERGFDPDMVSILSNYLYESTNNQPYVGVIHRLDKPVCGVMVYGKTKMATATLSKQLATNSFSKHYYAIVCLNDNTDIIPESASLHNFLLHDVKTNSSAVVPEGTKDSKEAILNYKLVKRFSIPSSLDDSTSNNEFKFALLDIELLTGRHHQIRVQLSHAGFPILGDKKYGLDLGTQLPLKIKRTGLALCAYSLSFTHPDTKKAMNFQAKPDNGIWATLF